MFAKYVDKNTNFLIPFCIIVGYIAPLGIFLYRGYIFLHYGENPTLNLLTIFPLLGPNTSWIGINDVLYWLMDFPLEFTVSAIGHLAMWFITLNWKD